ncbi:MAG TPA: translation initiation factor IF-2 associated domain-containing protein, partial [Caulobacteraceae bacterium]|nr:translation initiation factor IF-2 associated domain-containing protein [Caulobacteraceae bacterium]
MTDENENGRGAPNSGGRAPLTLKPRAPGGAVSSGVVKQSFSHGRSKTVVVETKRRRIDAPPANLAGPSTAEKRPAFDVRGPQPQRPSAPSASADHGHGLSAEELRARQKVAAEFARQQQ